MKTIRTTEAFSGCWLFAMKTEKGVDNCGQNLVSEAQPHFRVFSLYPIKSHHIQTHRLHPIKSHHTKEHTKWSGSAEYNFTSGLILICHMNR